MKSFSAVSAMAAAIVLPLATAQTYTSCNPTEKTCPADTGLNAASFKTDFTAGANAAWSAAGGTYLKYGSNGAEFTIDSIGQAPTISTNFYMLFGRVDVVFQAAPGTGVISSIVLESDDLDEIDWEFLGGDTTQAETNYFGKGNTTTYDRATYIPVTSPQSEMHTYTVDWTAERLQYIIDGNIVRTLNYADAVGGKNYPQTPMRVKLGNWTPPKDATGTIEWAGGPVDWSQAPFTMYVKSVSIQNYNPAGSYVYGDMSGSWQSIMIDGKSSSSSGSSSGSSGSSSSSAASSSAAATTVVGTGVASSSIPSTATIAPTSMHSVAPISMTDVAVSTTVVAYGNGTTVTSTPASGSATGSASMATSYTAPASSSSSSSVSSSGGSSQSTSAPNTNGVGAVRGPLALVSALALVLSSLML